MKTFPLLTWDWIAFGAFFVGLSVVGYWAGRKERGGAEDYFLAGKKLPWYVIGGSFIASNISTEHFIAMIGAACVYGVCVAMSEWGNVATFTLMIWFFIPFLLVSKVFTTPEFLERRFNPAMRQIFALVTIVLNVLAFLAAVLYGGGLALQKLFDWNSLLLSIVVLGLVAGVWAIYGGLSSVAWTDLFTVIVMVIGGLMVTILGLEALAGEDGSLIDGMQIVIERNRAASGDWAEAVNKHVVELSGSENHDSYNRLSVIQPPSHPTTPWIALPLSVFSISIWYNVLNQFMIQRVLGAKSMYHARMGIVMAGFMKVFLPVIVVLPGLILFAMKPDILLQPWDHVRTSADAGYVTLLRHLVPVGLRGLFLAALFGAIQSTVNSVLNSTATVITLDVYRRWVNPQASEKRLVAVGVLSSIVILAVAIILGYFIGQFTDGLFVYIQSMYAFFAPPFAAVFLLGILWRRINGTGAVVTVILGFGFAVLLKCIVSFVDGHPHWLEPYANQAVFDWAFCMVVCTVTSLLTAPPRPEQVSDEVTVNWKKLNIFQDLGNHWYTSVVTWWFLFVAAIAGMIVLFSGLIFSTG
ncbi:MAG: sodium/solute symporter [Pirellulales bacterium]|nr:sodium/solute symporter [Pirellulales bacterium]